MEPVVLFIPAKTDVCYLYQKLISNLSKHIIDLCMGAYLTEYYFWNNFSSRWKYITNCIFFRFIITCFRVFTKRPWLNLFFHNLPLRWRMFTIICLNLTYFMTNFLLDACDVFITNISFCSRYEKADMINILWLHKYRIQYPTVCEIIV